MTKGLRIAPGLLLPEEAVTETFCILAKRGKGKTYTASVMAEELVGAGLPVVVLDPTGVWWGLRSSADGKSDGLPVVIFGGEHGDLALEERAGSLIADVVVDERISAVVDVSALSKAKAKTFVADFLERLYHRNRDPLHVIVDEADMFAPQRTTHGGDVARALGAMEDLVRRGRARGLGTTLVTQRPAVLHKDVLTQAEVLVAMGMTGVRDVAAIDEWVRLHADEEQAVELKRSLPSLPQGTAWVWSPSWLSILKRVEVRARTTFDSSATPKAGQKRTVPKRMAAVDLDALGEKIAATRDRQKADDPRHLRQTIARLERELTAEQSKPAPEPERIEVPILSEELTARLEATLDRVSLAHTELAEQLSQASFLSDDSIELINSLRAVMRTASNTQTPVGAKQGTNPGRRSAPVASRPDIGTCGSRESGTPNTPKKVGGGGGGRAPPPPPPPRHRGRRPAREDGAEDPRRPGPARPAYAPAGGAAGRVQREGVHDRCRAREAAEGRLRRGRSADHRHPGGCGRRRRRSAADR